MCAGQVLSIPLSYNCQPPDCTSHGFVLDPVPCTLHPLDAAFLAREKAKADAECYTALKIAEANKVKGA
jgi:hypothetical protein